MVKEAIKLKKEAFQLGVDLLLPRIETSQLKVVLISGRGPQGRPRNSWIDFKSLFGLGTPWDPRGRAAKCCFVEGHLDWLA